MIPAVERYADIIVWSPRDYAAPADIKTAKPVYLHLPVFANRKDISVLFDNFRGYSYAGIMADNLYALTLAREWKTEVFAGLGLNILNQTTAENFQNVLLSVEITEPDYRLLTDWQARSYFLYAYGRLPLMALCHCPYKNIGFYCSEKHIACKSVTGGTVGGDTNSARTAVPVTKHSVIDNLTYEDERGNSFEIYKYRMDGCYFRLLNTVPHNLLKYKNKIKPHYFFDFRTCSFDTALKTLTAFADPEPQIPAGPHTAGLFFKWKSKG